MRNQRKNYFVKPGFQTKLTLIILLIVVIVANIVGGVIYGLLSGSTIIDQISKAFEIDNYRDLLLPVVLFAELVAIIIVTFIGVFVSHTMAGPVYRFEKVLDDIANGELDSHFHLRTSDEFQDLAGSINNLIATLNSKVSELKVYSTNVVNIMKEIDSPKSMTSYDIENIKNMLEKINGSLNYFSMVDVPSITVQGSEKGQEDVSCSVSVGAVAPNSAAEKTPLEAAEKLSSEDLIDVRKASPEAKPAVHSKKSARGGETKKKNSRRS